jgi:hypothetical protein
MTSKEIINCCVYAGLQHLHMTRALTLHLLHFLWSQCAVWQKCEYPVLLMSSLQM